MSYKKYVKKIPTIADIRNSSEKEKSNPVDINMTRAQNLLPMIYQGSSNRLDRYTVYDNMEQDPVISANLDVLADYIGNVEKGRIFRIEYKNSEVDDDQIKILDQLLKNWEAENDFKKRIFNIIRDTLKYGDTFFIRDPDTGNLMKCNPYDVIGVVVGDVKEPKWYIMRNLDENAPLKVANSARNDVAGINAIRSFNTMNGPFVNRVGNQQSPNNQGNQINFGQNDNNIVAVRAENVVHLSLNIDNMAQYPFGVSVLEKVYKVYIQKILLQDCILMMRIKHAPDRLVFKIPVGNVPRMMRRSYMERCRNEITQRRMPSKTSDGVFNTVDVAYDAMAMNEDYWLPIDSGNVQPNIERLQGSGNLGELTDLNYWDGQLIRGMDVPQSWQDYGTTQSTKTLPTTTAATLVQEERFFRNCNRKKYILSEPLDEEFKKYIVANGYNFYMDDFNISFNESSSINQMTQIDLDSKTLANYSTAIGLNGMSIRFAMKKYLGLSEEEIAENRQLFAEENPNRLKAKDIELPEPNKEQLPGLRSIGATDVDSSAIEALKDVFADKQAQQGGGLGAGGLGGADFGADMGGADFGADLGGGADMGGAPMGGASTPAPTNNAQGGL